VDGTDLAFAGLARQAHLIAAGEVSSRELTDLCLERIERIDPTLNAFRSVWAQSARAEADEADRRRTSGAEAPLLGVPVALKDEFADVQGDVSAIGTDAFTTPARADGEQVRRLREAGAVLIGKTNLPELAIYGFTESKRWGATRNPWDPSRTTGGSSGGSGAAVAAGLVGAGSASDGAGSIRIPAALCGLFGLKAQRGRVPLGPTGDPDAEHWRGMTVGGCVTRTVADTALWLDAVGRPPDGGSFAGHARSRPSRLRIAWSVRPPRLLVPPVIAEPVAGAVQEAVSLLDGLGHSVHQRDPDYGLVANRVSGRYLAGIRDDIRATEHPERLEPRTRGFARLAAAIGGDRAGRSAVRGEADDARRILAIFDECDVLVTPTVGTPPVEVGRWEGRGALRTVIGMSRVYPFTAVWNHLGNPAASVPFGATAEGLPLAIQLIGRPGDEATLLSLAAEIEAERPWADRLPPVG
jgi:amidase